MGQQVDNSFKAELQHSLNMIMDKDEHTSINLVYINNGHWLFLVQLAACTGNEQPAQLSTQDKFPGYTFCAAYKTKISLCKVYVSWVDLKHDVGGGN